MLGMIEFVVFPAAGAVALLVQWAMWRRRDAGASALLGTSFRISAELRAPGWRLLFDDKGRQLAVLSEEVRAVVHYDQIVGWRQEQEVPADATTDPPRLAVLLRTSDPRWPVLDVPLGTADPSVARLWLKRLNANVQHLRAAAEPSRSAEPARE